MFNFGTIQRYVDDPQITDIDCNGSVVMINHARYGKSYVDHQVPGALEDMLNQLCNYPQINREFNYQHPILDGTMDGLRIHAVHKSIMAPYGWLSIRKNPIELVVKQKEYPKMFQLLDVAMKAKWSIIYGGERGSGKTQWTRATIDMMDPSMSVTIIAENDEMHMKELLSDRLIGQYIINDIVDYKRCAASVLRDNSDYVVFQEVRDRAIDDLFLILSSCSRVLATLHVKEALLLPQRMLQLSEHANDQHLLSTIHDYIQLCIVPKAEYVNGEYKRYIGEIAMFWNDQEGNPQKQLIYHNAAGKESFFDLPAYYKNQLKQYGLKLSWKEKL